MSLLPLATELTQSILISYRKTLSNAITTDSCLIYAHQIKIQLRRTEDDIPDWLNAVTQIHRLWQWTGLPWDKSEYAKNIQVITSYEAKETSEIDLKKTCCEHKNLYLTIKLSKDNGFFKSYFL